MERYFSPQLSSLHDLCREVVERDVLPFARAVDEQCLWPEHAMRAFARAGLLGLQVPAELGGHGQGLVALAAMTDLIGRACPSSALCFGMHCVATAVIAAKATDYHRDRYLRPIAEGRHVTALALAERATGAHFYVPSTRATDHGDAFVVSGEKQFVTSGGHADSYVISVAPEPAGGQAGDFSCLVLDAGTEGLQWQQPWAGFGMRGNSARGLRIEQARVARENLLGAQGDQLWYVFEVVAPFFLVAMAGTYLGVAQSALEATGLHLRTRGYAHSGESLADIDAVQTRYASMWTAVEKTRGLVREAAVRGDAAHPEALPFILACKADAADTAVQVANEAMTLCGGMAYRENSRIAQMLRDARAAHVMAPTTDILQQWLGRSLLGRALL